MSHKQSCTIDWKIVTQYMNGLVQGHTVSDMTCFDKENCTSPLNCTHWKDKDITFLHYAMIVKSLLQAIEVKQEPYCAVRGCFLDTAPYLGPLGSSRSYRTPDWTFPTAASTCPNTSLCLMDSFNVCRWFLRASQQSCSRSFSSAVSRLESQTGTC